MASEWFESTLGEFCPLTYGKGLPERSRDAKGAVPVYGSNGVVGMHSDPYVDEPGVVVGRKGTVGAVHFSAQPFWPIDTTFYITGGPQRDIRFTYYLLRSLPLEHLNSDSAVPGLNRDAAHSIKVRIPDIDTQRRIADILGKLDDKIELNRRMNRTLEKMAAAIFKSWFIDFDPVHAKAEGRAPNLPAEIAALFPDSFEDSAVGPIPKGWKAKPLPEAIDINPKRTLAKGTLAPFLEMSNMPTRGPSPDAWRLREMGSGMKFVNGDTLVARITPCLENGKTAFVDFLADGEVGWGSTEYIVLRPLGDIPPVFAYLLARTGDFRSFAIQQMTGSSGRQRVPAESLSKYLIVRPEVNSPIFRAFGQFVSPLFRRISAAMRQSRNLARMRDTLLPKLLSGEIELPEAEAIAEEVT